MLLVLVKFQIILAKILMKNLILIMFGNVGLKKQLKHKWLHLEHMD